MLCVETLGKMRRWYHVDKLSISKIAKRLGPSRNTIKRYLRSKTIVSKYKEREKRYPVMGPWKTALQGKLSQDAQHPPKQRRTATRVFEEMRAEGFTGSYITV